MHASIADYNLQVFPAYIIPVAMAVRTFHGVSGERGQMKTRHSKSWGGYTDYTVCQFPAIKWMTEVL